MLIDAADRAKIPDTAKSVTGGGKKVAALEIAKAAACDYNMLTHEPPSRSYKDTDFVDFLAAIFKALGRLDDSVDNLAKQACEWWRSDARAREDKDWLKKLPPPPGVVED